MTTHSVSSTQKIGFWDVVCFSETFESKSTCRYLAEKALEATRLYLNIKRSYKTVFIQPPSNNDPKPSEYLGGEGQEENATSTQIALKCFTYSCSLGILPLVACLVNWGLSKALSISTIDKEQSVSVYYMMHLEEEPVEKELANDTNNTNNIKPLPAKQLRMLENLIFSPHLQKGTRSWIREINTFIEGLELYANATDDFLIVHTRIAKALNTSKLFTSENLTQESISLFLGTLIKRLELSQNKGFNKEFRQEVLDLYLGFSQGTLKNKIASFISSAGYDLLKSYASD